MRAGWFLAGGVAGIYASAKVRRAADTFSRDALHDRLTGWFAGARVLHEELLLGTVEKETELRTRLAVRPDGEATVRALPPPPAPDPAPLLPPKDDT